MTFHVDEWVIYTPPHAQGMTTYDDAQVGYVSTVNGDRIFVRFDTPHGTGCLCLPGPGQLHKVPTVLGYPVFSEALQRKMKRHFFADPESQWSCCRLEINEYDNAGYVSADGVLFTCGFIGNEPPLIETVRRFTDPRALPEKLRKLVFFASSEGVLSDGVQQEIGL